MTTGIKVVHPLLGVFKASPLWGSLASGSAAVLEFFTKLGALSKAQKGPLGRRRAGVPFQVQEAAPLYGPAG